MARRPTRYLCSGTRLTVPAIQPSQLLQWRKIRAGPAPRPPARGTCPERDKKRTPRGTTSSFPPSTKWNHVDVSCADPTLDSRNFICCLQRDLVCCLHSFQDGRAVCVLCKVFACSDQKIGELIRLPGLSDSPCIK